MRRGTRVVVGCVWICILTFHATALPVLQSAGVQRRVFDGVRSSPVQLRVVAEQEEDEVNHQQITPENETDVSVAMLDEDEETTANDEEEAEIARDLEDTQQSKTGDSEDKQKKKPKRTRRTNTSRRRPRKKPKKNSVTKTNAKNTRPRKRKRKPSVRRVQHSKVTDKQRLKSLQIRARLRSRRKQFVDRSKPTRKNAKLVKTLRDLGRAGLTGTDVASGREMQTPSYKADTQLLLSFYRQDFSWAIPKQYTQEDLRKHLNIEKDKPLTNAHLFTLAYTNIKLADGEQITLEKTWSKLPDLQKRSRSLPPLYSEDDAKHLDGKDSQLLSPLEAECLKYTNEEIALGGKNTVLLKNYREIYLRQYKHNPSGARADATRLVDALAGVGTDEAAAMAVLDGLTKHQVAILNTAFTKELARRKLLTLVPKGYSTPLEYWLLDDVSGGWKSKLMDAYHARPARPDHKHFWLHAVAFWMQQNVQAAFQHTVKGRSDSRVSVRALSHMTFFMFNSVSTINAGLGSAVDFWSKKMHKSQGVMKAVYLVPTFGVAVAAALVGPLRAVDPKLSTEEVREGLIDAAVLIGTMGGGAVLRAGAKGGVSAAVLVRTARAARHFKIQLYGLARIAKLGKTPAQFMTAANKYRALAAKAGLAARQKKSALRAAERLERTSKLAARADKAVRKADKLQTAVKNLRAAGKGAGTPGFLKAVNRADKAAARAHSLVLKLRTAAVQAAKHEKGARRFLGIPVTGPITIAARTVIAGQANAVATTARDEAVAQALEAQKEKKEKALAADVEWRRGNVERGASRLRPKGTADRLDKKVDTILSGNNKGKND